MRYLLLCLIPFFSGCNASKDSLQQFEKTYVASEYLQCLEFSKNLVSQKEKPSGSDLLWRLHQASCERMVGDYSGSNATFDASEDMLKYFDLEGNVADILVSTAVNDNALPYRGTSYDAIMVNVYKGLSFMSLGEKSLARVEFNRALDRQRRAKEKYQKDIKKLKENIDKDNSISSDTRKNAQDPKLRDKIEQQYSNVFEFEAYPDFVNPFATYISALFFAFDGDETKAIDLLKETYGMAADNKYIAEDLDRLSNATESFNNNVWVIFENGLGPIKEEVRIDLPLILAASDIYYAGIALPMLKMRSNALGKITVNSDDESKETLIVADIGRVVKTEFDKEFNYILTRAIISATTKALLQRELGRNSGSSGVLASAMAAVYTAATTAADVRIWSTLPNEFQVARVSMPRSKIVSLVLAGESKNIELDDCENAIIYVKLATSNSEPIIDVIYP